MKRIISFVLIALVFGACHQDPYLPKNSPELAQKIAICAQIPASVDPQEFYARYRELIPQRKWFLIVDKTHILKENYEPKDLVYQEPFPRVRKEVLRQLQKMHQAAEQENIPLKVISGYRTLFHQKILNQKTPDNPFLAPPGASQHHLGTSVDFDINYKEAEPPSATQIWLEKYATEYGFSLSYPREAEKETGYPYEPWHYRYITQKGVAFQNDFFNGSQHKMLYFWEQCPPEKFV